MTSVDDVYGDFWAGEQDPVDVELQRSLDPRGTDSLFATFAALGPQPGQLLVDAGARDARHTIRLVREHGLRAIAFDPVPHHLGLARQAVEEAGLDIEVESGRTEQMPVADGAADWVWCRDVLVHVDLARTFAEFVRVLRCGGHAIVYVTVATELLEPRERQELFDGVAIPSESADPQAIEARAADAGLTLVSKETIAGEWREQMIEEGSWNPGEDLARLSRLRRFEGAIVERYGAARVAAYAAGLRWGIYQLLGKLCPTIYVWRRDA
jgi:ubiquinone/menaquinone biosynthesis C-methylase UbiE